MTEYNTSKRNYLRTQQTIFTSSNPQYNNTYDLEVAVLATKLSKPYNTVNVPSDWREYFYSKGGSGSNTYALSFNGADESVSVPAAVGTGTVGSFSMWIKDWASTGIDTLYYEANDGIGDYINVYHQGSGIFFIGGIAGLFGAASATTGSVGSSGEWHLIVATWNANGVAIYLDGVLKDSSTFDSGQLTKTSCDATYICSSSTGNYWSGKSDDTIIWDRELTSDEVADLWKGGSGVYVTTDGSFPSTSTPYSTNLKALYHFDEGTGPTAIDSSGNGYNGALVNMDVSNYVTGFITSSSSSDYLDAYTTDLTKLWWRFLTASGYTQKSLRDKFKAFYDDGTVDL